MKSRENFRQLGNKEKIKTGETQITRRGLLRLTALAGAGVVAGSAADRLERAARGLTFDKEKVQGLARVAEEMKGIYPEVDQWFDASEWTKSVIDACRKNDVQASDENIAAILTIIRSSSGFREVPRSYDNLPTPSERTVAGLLPIEPNTGGPMEVAYEEVARRRNMTREQAVNFVETRDGGIDAGVEKLADIIRMYSLVENEESRLKCIFADWNAGSGSSKTAGMQRYLNKIAETNLAEDGVMGPRTIALFEKYRGKIKEADIEPIPAALPVRGLTGVAKKILTGVGTSRDYADKRFEDYRRIKKLMSDYVPKGKPLV